MTEHDDSPLEKEEIFRQEVQPRKDGNSFVLPLPTALNQMSLLRNKRFFWVVTKEGMTLTTKVEVTKSTP